MPQDVLQRIAWSGTPVDQGECFRLVKDKRLAVCRLFTHQFGWELRLEVDEDLVRSEICRSQNSVFETFEAWRARLIDKGWNSKRKEQDR